MNSYIREPGNFITHFLPALLSIPGIWLLLEKSVNLTQTIAALVYGGGMLLLFSVSATYHSVPKTPYGIRFWQKFDHCCIYLMIAGSFTPTVLIVFEGVLKWVLISFVWLIALIGGLLKIFNRLKRQSVSTGLYIAMGCLIIPFIARLLETVPLMGLIWLFLGGVFYIGGTYFYAKDKPLYKYLHSHELWHIFVNLGALSHYIYNYGYVFSTAI
jgi:hemolysin III